MNPTHCQIKSPKGRIIVDIIPCSHTRASGLVIVDRKNISEKGVVVSVGADSMTAKGKPIKAPCSVGDVAYFRKYQPMFHTYTTDGMRKGLCTLWFEDCLCYTERTINDRNHP